MRTPWGISDEEIQLAPNVLWVITPSHGGVMVAPDTAANSLSDKARNLAERFGRWYCYEEDCLWAVFAYERPEAMLKIASWPEHERTVEQIKTEAEETVKHWYPSYLGLPSCTHTDNGGYVCGHGVDEGETLCWRHKRIAE